METVKPQTTGVLETCLYVDDLDAAQHFYEQILGLELFSRVDGRHAFFKCGSGMLLLFKPEASRQGNDLPGHGTHGPGHCCLRIAEETYLTWKVYLQAHHVPIIAEQDWPRGGRSMYFHDPSGNVLELAPARIWGL